MRVRTVIGSTVVAAAAIGALSGIGAGLASAGPGDVTHHDNGYVEWDSIDLGTGSDAVLTDTIQ
ncbi:MAG: hypothetical protein SW127_09980 [Actinomycetota bacterium]|nr:hypothetical protein [Actinomycetota bacterium]